MPKAISYGKTERMSFARYEEIQNMPNLLEIQKNSYRWFLEEGLRDVFRDVDAVTDYSGNLELRFVDYSMDEKPKYTEEECKARDATYAKPLKVRVRLRNKETEEIKEQEIFMGDFPLMTPSGTFVINGAERVIVSQIVRSPGVYYDKRTDKAYNSTYGTTVIPYHGAWLEYETDLNDVFYCRIDKNRKLPVTWFLKAMGAYREDDPNTWLSCIPNTSVGCVNDAQIKEIFANDERILATLDKDTGISREEVSAMANMGEEEGVIDNSENKVIQNIIKLDDIKAYDVMTPRVVAAIAPESMTLKQFYKQEELSHNSRIPVYADSPEFITGYIMRYDVLENLAEDKFDTRLRSIKRKIAAFHEETSVSDIWESLLKTKDQIALIIDDYGCFQGIITLEDIIETILGMEIIDENDTITDMQQYAKERWLKRKNQYKQIVLPDEDHEEQQ